MVVTAHGLRDEFYRLRTEPAFRKTYSTGYTSLDDIVKLAKGYLAVITGYPGSGKALALDTPIPSPAGWRTMGELQPGDIIFDDAGQPCTVTRVTEIMHNRDCYEMTFSCGTTIVCDADHLWVTRDDKARMSEGHARRNNRITPRALKTKGTDKSHKRSYPSAKTTREIAETLIVNGRINHVVMNCAPVQGEEQILPIAPYTLGVWLGDGRTDYASLYCEEAEMRERIVSEGYVLRKQAQDHTYGIIDGFVGKLRSLDLLGNKHVPPIYLHASFKQRLALLNGLLDSDGYCSENGHCEFCSTTKSLAEAVKMLLCSMGIKAVMSEGRAKLYGKDCGPKYRVIFTPWNLNPFSLKRKASRVKLTTKNTPLDKRSIIQCRPVASVPVKCITVDSPSHLYLCTHSYIPTHNTEWLDAVLVNCSLLHNWQTLYFSPENYPIQEHIAKLAEKLVGKWVRQFSDEETERVLKQLNTHFAWIDIDKEFPTVEQILERAAQRKETLGLDCLVIDPWNGVRHEKNVHQREDEYLAEILTKISYFARRHHLFIAIVAHPKTAIKGKDNKLPPCTVADISGGAMWWNKVDYAFVAHRPDYQKNEIEIEVAKIKQKWMGTLGSKVLDYDRRTGRFKCQRDKDFLLPVEAAPPF